jgi:hypothetical protein
VPTRSLAFTKSIAALLTLLIALVTVGLTASADGPFTIAVRPVFLRLGLNFDVKIGSMHVHATWSALPDPSTKPDTNAF